MKLDRQTWTKKEFTNLNDGKWICPNCLSAKLRVLSGSINKQDSAYSKKVIEHEDWEQDWLENHFVAFLKCPDPDCQESVSISGNVTYYEEFSKTIEG